MPSQSPEIKVYLTGTKGFIFSNLLLRLEESPQIKVVTETPTDKVDFVLLLNDFSSIYFGDNTSKLDSLPSDIDIKYLYQISRQVICLNNVEGKAKPLYFESDGKTLRSIDLPNVFGKWASPNSDNVIGKACFNIIRNQDTGLQSNTVYELLYIDDLVENIITYMLDNENNMINIKPIYKLKGEEINDALYSIRENRKTLIIPEVGKGFLRALYATYISYLEPNKFSYPLESHSDNRGNFIEFLKTSDHGQVSCFTAGPGITRGQHYHQTKTEKFLVASGQAKFCFRNLLTGKKHEIHTSAENPEVVESIPGWVHNITNTGDSEMIVVLWANELFDPEHPDTNPDEI